MNQIKVVKRIHAGWLEHPEKIIGHLVFGKYQYLYSVGKNQVSLIQLYGYPIGNKLEDNWDSFQWEIHGYGLPDVERFNTKDEAEARCWELLLTPRGEEMP